MGFHRQIFARLYPFSQVFLPLNKALLSYLPVSGSTTTLLPKYTLTLVLGLHLLKHGVSFTDCFAALQMAQHFVDERV